MKLELKHIAGYLPYVFKGISTEEDFGIEIVKGYSIYGKYDTICLQTNVDDIDLNLFKPILRPLSDLTKEIEHNGEHFFPYEKLHLKRTNVEDFLNEDLWIGQWWTYDNIEKLFEWHFDIHGLIEKGLAIDINALNEK